MFKLCAKGDWPVSGKSCHVAESQDRSCLCPRSQLLCLHWYLQLLIHHLAVIKFYSSIDCRIEGSRPMRWRALTQAIVALAESKFVT